MTIGLRYVVWCDHTHGDGRKCVRRVEGEGNAVRAVSDARAAGWDVRRHEAYCTEHKRSPEAERE